MYSFFVLLSLTLITWALGWVLVFTPQVEDYVRFIVLLEGNPDTARLPIQIVVHIATYATACFLQIATIHTISRPDVRDSWYRLYRLQMALEAIFVAVPSVVIIALATHPMPYGADATTDAQLALAPLNQAGPASVLVKITVAVAAVILATVVVSGRSFGTRSFRLTLVAVVAGIPIAHWIIFLASMLATGERVSVLLTLAGSLGAIGLAISVAAVVLVKRPLALFHSTLRPLDIKVPDGIAGLALAAWLGVCVSLILHPAESATFLGMFPVLFVASSVALIVLAALIGKGSSTAIVSASVSVIIGMHFLDGWMPTREFRYRSELPLVLKDKVLRAKEIPLSIAEVTKARGIMELDEAFLAWLKVRQPAIEAYRKKGKSYPVFVVAAQGGGIYAAYHSALSLARLYNSCPEIVNHMFVFSGISGGALGSAVFTELLRGVPDQLRPKPDDVSEGCNPRPGAPILEKQVKAFFAADFLSPVVDSALLFDIPSLLVPWMRFGLDRAFALESAFEHAWQKLTKEKSAQERKGQSPAYGLAANFYGRWTPDGPAPALVLSATSVKSGVPVLISQIKWAKGQSFRLPLRTEAVSGHGLLERIKRTQEREGGNESAFFLGQCRHRQHPRLPAGPADSHQHGGAAECTIPLCVAARKHRPSF